MVLRRIFGSKRDEVTRGRRKIHNDKLYDLYCSPNIVRVIELRRLMWHLERVQDKKDAYRILMGKPG